MAAYLFIKTKIHDPAQYAKYLHLVSEWPSVEVARQFWNSGEYRAVRALRADAGDVHVTLTEDVPV